ncbi:MAG: 2-C-methyl-D-erythritol 4-phosphate cytidylyltransferase [Acidobacteriota bacterium]|nr:2-C-methyl-D-erythritol 4-phosphate cytidylyltransferase [Acidobacteriota bacterium]MDW3229247.1 2-C-methyl-D-erythritol 4-phosphate cytidylyltransferase [Acidobacteriota bacterium]MDY0231751.1 2-C-methyl-D-erythritol 4-phosphate cytidylyltransferase [Candidatus Saccharicenans sp.]
MKTTVIILGGGRGTRLGLAFPKQFAPLQNRPLFDYSVEKFITLKVDRIIAVLINGYHNYYQPHPAIFKIAPAGQTRQESVLSGLRSCPQETDLVIIHDSARPFFPMKAVAKGLESLKKDDYDGLALAIPATDSLVKVEGQEIISFPERGKIYFTQTPQLFQFDKIRSAYEKLKGQSFTDDLSLAKTAGLRCGLLPGSQMNFKITSEFDWYLARQLLESGRWPLC